MSETKTDEEFAREWMAMPGHEPRVGMRSVSGCVVVCTVRRAGYFRVYRDGEGVVLTDMGSIGPWDLDHPGTRAFLLEDVRKAWGEQASFTVSSGLVESPYVVVWPDAEEIVKDKAFYGACEAAALMAALRAAPGEEARRG